MLKTTALMMATTALVAGPALAGSITAPEPEPVIVQPVPPAPVSPNWTGFYGGVELGYANADPSGASSDDNVIGGVVAGYDFDLQNGWVIGAGLDYDFTDLDVSPTASLEELFRAKLRAGYKIGDGLLYGTGGFAYADTDDVGDSNGWFAGGGYEHMITRNISIGGEVLYHEFDDFNNSSVDVDVVTVQARATFRF